MFLRNVIVTDPTRQTRDIMTNDGILLAQRLRRWPNNMPPLVERLVFTGYLKIVEIIDRLKGLAQPKLIKKSVILFWVLNMTI